MKSKFLSTLIILSVIFTSCSKDDSDDTDPVGEETKVTLVTRSDVSFELDVSENTDPSRVYSTLEGKNYKFSEIATKVVESIDVVSFTNKAFIGFESLTDVRPEISGATVSIFQHTNVTLTYADFDAMSDDTKLKDLSIINDGESISINGYQDKIVLFQNAAGKKGAIKLKSLNSQRILVDIKIMK